MPDQPRTSRRAALAVVGAGVVPLLTACEAGGLLPSDLPGRDDQSTADDGVLTEARAEVAAVSAVVAQVQARHRRLREPLSALDRMHAAHAGALGEAPSGPATAAPGGPEPVERPAAALARVRRRERAHQRRLADLAVRAGSGQLAQVLASMSAAAAQHVAVLPPEVPS